MTTPNKQLDNLIDVVIPTFNRPDFLKRILEYYQTADNSFRFLIADSSSKSKKRKNKKVIAGFSKLNIHYIDKFPETLPQHHKFIEIVKFLKRKYCVFCADDDFIISNSVRECVAFLEKNPDYSAAHGVYLGYHFLEVSGFIKKLLWKARYIPHTIDNTNSLKRLGSHLENYILVLWAVRRSSQIKKIYSEFKKANVDPYLLPNLGELIPDALTVISGKIKVFSTAYGVRQYFGSIAGYFPSFLDAKKIGKYEESYSDFKKILLRNLPAEDKQDRDAAVALIDSAMEKYISYTYGEHFMNRINLILRRFPKPVSQAIRQLHALYLFSKKENGLVKKITGKSSKHFEDLNIIKESIIKSNI